MSTPTMPEDAIAALFAAAEEGTLPEERRPAPGRAGHSSVRTVDFRRPRQFTGEVQRRLRRMLDTFCRTASSRLSSELRTPVDLEVIGVEQLTWSDAHHQLPTSSLTGILTTEPFKTRMVLSAEIGLLLASIERMLGGSGEQSPPLRRLTDIDMMLTGELFDLLTGQLSVLWFELVEASLAVTSVVGHQGTAQLAPTSEPTLAFTIEVKLLAISTTIVLLVPYRSIAPVVDVLSIADGMDPSSDRSIAGAMRHGIGSVDVELRVEVGSLELSIAEVLAISPGDVLALGVNSRAGVTLLVDDTPIGRGRPGRSGPRRAVQTFAGHEGPS